MSPEEKRSLAKHEQAIERTAKLLDKAREKNAQLDDADEKAGRPRECDLPIETRLKTVFAATQAGLILVNRGDKDKGLDCIAEAFCLLEGILETIGPNHLTMIEVAPVSVAPTLVH